MRLFYSLCLINAIYFYDLSSFLSKKTLDRNVNKLDCAMQSMFISEFAVDSRIIFEERMKRIFIALNVRTDSELARSLGITPPSVASARQKMLVPIGWIERISTVSNISMDWLYYGTGTMRPEELQTTALNTSPLLINAVQCDVDIIMVPMANAKLSAGCGSLEVDDTYERKYAFRSDFLYRKGNPDNMILMRVAGDSMSPEIENNDVVLLDQSKKEIIVGTLYAVGFEDAIYLKRIDKLPGKIVLKSTNKDYPPVELDINGDCEDLFRVIGRVLWCGREYK